MKLQELFGDMKRNNSDLIGEDLNERFFDELEKKAIPGTLEELEKLQKRELEKEKQVEASDLLMGVVIGGRLTPIAN